MYIYQYLHRHLQQYAPDMYISLYKAIRIIIMNMQYITLKKYLLNSKKMYYISKYWYSKH